MEDSLIKPSIFNVDSIYRNIGTFGNLQLKHRVNLYMKDKTVKAIPYGKSFVSTKSNGGIIGFPSVAFRQTRDSIVIEGYSGSQVSINGEKKVQKSVLLTYNDLSEVKRIFNEAADWFTKEPYRNDLFKYENNIPYGISQRYEGLNATASLTSGMKGSFITIKPIVITDALNNIGYPGVVIGCNMGFIGSCTMTEFLSLKDLIIKYLLDLYSLSVELINHYLLAQLTKGGINK